MGCARSSEYKKEDPNSNDTLQANKRQSRDANQEFMKKLAAVRRVPIFKFLSQGHHPLLAGAVETVVFEPGDKVIQQGDIGSDFFIIDKGDAVVYAEIDGELKQTGIMTAGDYFGEQAILFDQQCNMTVQASTQLTCFTITRGKFVELRLGEKVKFPKRQAFRPIPVDTKDPKAERAGSGKSPEERQFIKVSLMQNTHLMTTLGLTESTAEMMAERFWLESVKEGQAVIRQGDESSDCFYLVASGAFDRLQQDLEGNASSEKVGCVEPSGSFGELALICPTAEAATVQATKDSTVWVLDRAAFLAVKREAVIRQYAAVFNRVKIFAPLLNLEKQALIEALVPLNFKQDDEVVTEGNPETAFYILTEGEIAKVKNGEQVKTLVASPGNVHYFGENMLRRESKPATLTVKVISPVAKTLVLDQDVIEALQETVDHRFSCARMTARASAMDGARARVSQFGKRKIDELKLIGILGVGAFGKVELRQDKKTGETFAVKSMSKGYIVKKRMQSNVANELQIMLSVNSPFIICLYGTSKAQQWIYFLMEPALGGDLMTAYMQHSLYGKPAAAKYYVGSVALALNHLHERYVIYRDLKPENLLLNNEGRLKMTDMGLAKFSPGKTYTMCGTLEYFAPETIQLQGQTRAVDWWAVGVLMYELMHGNTPFHGASQAEVFENVIRGIEPVPFRSSIGEMKSFVHEVLKRDPAERLPMKPEGVENLKRHPVFSDFDWEALACGYQTPPYTPKISSKVDITNIKRDNRLQSWEEYVDDGSGWDNEF